MPSASRLAALALAAAACKSSPPHGALAVGRVVVGEAALAGKPEIAESVEHLRVELREALEASGRFTMREGGPVTVQLEIDRAQRTLAPPATPDPLQPLDEREVADVALTLEMISTGAQGDIDRLIAEGAARRATNADDSLDPAVRHAAFDAALDAALRDAVAALRDQIDARNKNEAALIRDLSDPSPRLRDYAIRVLADRRSPAAVPALIARLQDPSPEVARRAAGALIAIGDRRAVPPLIEMTHHRRSEDVGPILYAISSLGGPEAEAFLFTLESGAPDEETRRSARAAYGELLRRKQEEAGKISERRAAP
ncbi:MAG TPA: HEAT repeat domain-containing protein [Myxococcales bacterium]|nr:HEAT repeat domain-containing protein [Myxococcales bacterium]